MTAPTHRFHAVAFVENFSLKALAPHYPGAKVTTHDIFVKLDGDAEMLLYPFGAVVFRDVPEERRLAELKRLQSATTVDIKEAVREDFRVALDPSQAGTRVHEGMLVVDRLTPGRSAIVALTVAQSAAMEYYERIVDDLFARMVRMVDPLERHGTVPMRVRPLHRFIGEATNTRNEVIAVLHLLDKPDATWEDPAMDRIYDDLRAEFDLVDRYRALEHKLRSVQESLQLVLDVVRDRRLVILEAAIVILIVVDIVMGLWEKLVA